MSAVGAAGEGVGGLGAAAASGGAARVKAPVRGRVLLRVMSMGGIGAAAGGSLETV